MNKFEIDETSIIGLKDVSGRCPELKEGTIYPCDIPFAHYNQAKNEVEIVFGLWDEKRKKDYYILNKMKVDSEEFNLLLEDIYATHGAIFAIDLNDFRFFYGYCKVEFVNGYTKVIICDLEETPVSDLAVALYGRHY